MQQTLENFLRLKQSNEQELSNFLIEHQKQFFESCGGLTNVIELCLTHPNNSQYINTQSNQFQSLKHKLKDKLNENIYNQQIDRNSQNKLTQSNNTQQLQPQLIHQQGKQAGRPIQNIHTSQEFNDRENSLLIDNQSRSCDKDIQYDFK